MDKSVCLNINTGMERAENLTDKYIEVRMCARVCVCVCVCVCVNSCWSNDTDLFSLIDNVFEYLV